MQATAPKNAAPKSKKVFPAWERAALDKFNRSLSPERAARDQRLLADVFNMAAGVPVLKEALDWARENDIAFIVDETATGVRGYYNVGTGVVALGLEGLNNRSKIIVTGTLVHELRHAWQDTQGMISTAGHSFTEYYTKIALIEADAEAHGLLARRQAMLYEKRQQFERDRRANPAAAQTAAADLERTAALHANDPQPLWRFFKGWFSSWMAPCYGTAAARLWGVKLGVPGVTKRDFNVEYKPYEGKMAPVVEGLDFSRPEQLRRLGKGFSGASCKNYFNDAAKDDALRRLLTPTAAARFFRGTEQTPLVRELRRRDMLLRREKGFSPLIALD
jgi:hypothetical protein